MEATNAFVQAHPLWSVIVLIILWGPMWIFAARRSR
jgi:hypothetical protein